MELGASAGVATIRTGTIQPIGPRIVTLEGFEPSTIGF